MPPSKRPTAPPSTPPKRKGFDFTTPAKRTKDPNVVEQFIIKSEDGSCRWYARVGVAEGADIRQKLNTHFEAGIGGALIYRVDLSNKGDCVTNAVFAEKAVHELADALRPMLTPPMTLGELQNAHLIPPTPTLMIETYNDYVKAGDGWKRLKKWLLNDNFLAGTELEDGSGVTFMKTEAEDEEYWVNSLRDLCEAKGYATTVAEQWSALALPVTRRDLIWALHPNAHRAPSFVITADERAELVKWKQQSRTYEEYMEDDPASDADSDSDRMSDCSISTIPADVAPRPFGYERVVLHETQSRGMMHTHAIAWQHDDDLLHSSHIGWREYVLKYIKK